MIGLFFGAAKRNGLLKLSNPHPVADYGTHDLCSGNAGLDGFTTLSRADPSRQGNPPPVAGIEGPIYSGPTGDFEQ